MIYSYARVSTEEQSVAVQVEALAGAGAAKSSGKWQAELRPTAPSFTGWQNLNETSFAHAPEKDTPRQKCGASSSGRPSSSLHTGGAKLLRGTRRARRSPTSAVVAMSTTARSSGSGRQGRSLV